MKRRFIWQTVSWVSHVSRFYKSQIHTLCGQCIGSSDVGVVIQFANVTNLICWNRGWRWSLWGWWSVSWFGTFSQGTILSNSASCFSSHNLDIAPISPVVSPGILDQPIRFSILSSISNNSDSMVDFCGGTLVKNTLFNVAKTTITCIDSSGNSSIFVD